MKHDSPSHNYKRRKVQYLMVLTFRRHLSQMYAATETASKRPKTKPTEAVRNEDVRQQGVVNGELDDATRHSGADMIDIVVNAGDTAASAISDVKDKDTSASNPRIVRDPHVHCGARAGDGTFHASNVHRDEYSSNHVVTEDKVCDGVPENIEQERGVVVYVTNANHDRKEVSPTSQAMTNCDNTPNDKDTYSTIVNETQPCLSGLRDGHFTLPVAVCEEIHGNDTVSEVFQDNARRTFGVDRKRSLRLGDLTTRRKERKKKIQDALEYYTIKGNGSSTPCIKPIKPFQRPWIDLPSFETIDYSGEDLTVGNIIEIKTQDSGDNLIVEVNKIRSLQDGRYLFLVSWYCSRKEMYDSRCKNKEEWPQGHSHMKSTHMQVIMWDTTNRRVSTTESRKFSPGRIFDWYHKPTLICHQI